jgi:hypothetical protein
MEMTSSISRPLRGEFPRFYASSRLKDSLNWDGPARWEDRQFVSTVCNFFDAHAADLGPLAPDELPGLAHAVLLDLLEIKGRETSPASRLRLNYLQLYLGNTLVNSGNMWGRLQIAHDWIIHSLCDVVPYGPEEEIQNLRLADFIKHATDLGTDPVGVVLDWLSGFFYYSRRRSAFRENGHLLFNLAGGLASTSLATPNYREAVGCALNALNWCVFNPRPEEETRELARLLEGLHSSPAFPKEERKRIGILFSTMAGRFSSAEPREWAERTLTEHREVLVGHEEVQLLVSCCAKVEEAERRREEVLDGLRRLSASFRAMNPSGAALRYGLERLFDILGPLVFCLMEGARCDYLLEVLSEWYQVPNPRGRTGLFVCLSTYGHGILYGFEGNLVVERRDPDPSLRAVTEAANRFLGTYVTLSHDPELPATAPERPGVPAESHGMEFEPRLVDHYALDRLKPRLEPMLAESKLLMSIPGQPHPLQALLLKATGRTLPLAGSLQEPQPDRPLRRVLIWPGGVFTEQFEVDAVCERFDHHGVAAEVVDQAQLTLDRFRTAYASPDFDAIWITSHGFFNHWDPHTAYLQLNRDGDQRMLLEELVDTPFSGSGRRLLVLNVCDGGTAATLGGALGIGIAPMVASSNQAVISHMWPVDQRISPAFGALLAVGLTREHGYFAAFEFALGSLLRGREAVLAELRANLSPGSELVDRVERRSIDSENIMFWGSPVFYE